MKKKRHDRKDKRSGVRCLSFLTAMIILLTSVGWNFSGMPVAAEEANHKPAAEASLDTNDDLTDANGASVDVNHKTKESKEQTTVSNETKKALAKADEKTESDEGETPEDKASLNVTVTPSDTNRSFVLGQSGMIYNGQKKSITFTMHMKVHFPNDVSLTSRQIVMTLPYGMTWWGWADPNSLKSFKGESWFNELKNPGNSTNGLPREKLNDSLDTYSGTVTLDFKPGTENVEFDVKCFTTETQYGTTGITSINNPITVKLQCGTQEKPDEISQTRKLDQLTLPKSYLHTGSARFSDRTNVDAEGNLVVSEDGTNAAAYYLAYASRDDNRPSSAHIRDLYSVSFQMPAGIEYKGLSLPGGWDGNGPRVTDKIFNAGETFTYHDGKTVTVPEGQQIITLTMNPKVGFSGGNRRSAVSGDTAFCPVWYFPKDKFTGDYDPEQPAKEHQTYTISMVDANLTCHNCTDALEYATNNTLPSEQYVIAVKKEHIFVNVQYKDRDHDEGYISDATYRNVSEDSSSNLSYGIPEYKKIQESTAGYFVLGNRGTGDSVPKVISITYGYESTHAGDIGITEQQFLRFNDEKSYPDTKITNLKVTIWNPETGEQKEHTFSDGDVSRLGSTVRMTDLPEYQKGWYLRNVEYTVDKIPAMSTFPTAYYYGVVLKDGSYDVASGNYKSIINITNKNTEDTFKNLTGSTWTGLSGKMREPVVASNSPGKLEEVDIGKSKKISFAYDRAVEDRGCILDEIYIISPTGDMLRNISVSYWRKGLNNVSGTIQQPKITEIDSYPDYSYPKGTEYMPNEAFKNAFPGMNPRIYKLEFDQISDGNEAVQDSALYNARLNGGVVVTDKAANAEYKNSGYLLSRKWHDGGHAGQFVINATIDSAVTDRINTSFGNCVWIKTKYPEEALSDTEHYQFSGGQKDIYNLTGNTNNIVTGNNGFRFTGSADMTVVSSAKQSTESETAYRTWNSKDETLVGANSLINYKLEILNNSAGPVDNMTLYVPVPKKGQYWGDKVQDSDEGAFKFDMSLTEAPVVPEGYSLYVAHVDDGNVSKNPSTWENYTWTPLSATSKWTSQDWKNVNFIKIVRNTPMPAGEDAIVTYDLVGENYDAEQVQNKDRNIWRPYYTRRISQGTSTAEGFRQGEPVAAVLAPGLIEGKVWEDKNADGYIDSDESGIGNVSVQLIEKDGYGRFNQTATTDSDGNYSFKGLLPGYHFTIEVINPNRMAYSAFSPKPEKDMKTESSMKFTSADDINATADADITSDTPSFLNMNCGLLGNIVVTATKVWNIKEDDSKKMNSLKQDVTLYLTKKVGNGEVKRVTDASGKEKSIVISKNASGDALTVRWENLPVKENGEHIEYGVEEKPIAGYKSKITSNDAKTVFTVTNTPGVSLPDTGGSGTNVYYLIGIFLISFAGVYMMLMAGRRNQ